MPRKCLERRIKLLTTFLEKPNKNYIKIIDEIEIEDCDIKLLQTHQLDRLKYRSLYLRLAYIIALEKMPQKKFEDCCDEAITQINGSTFLSKIRTPKVLMRWQREFRTRNSCPNNKMKYSKDEKKIGIDPSPQDTQERNTTSLVFLRRSCSDFRNEKTKIEHLLEEIAKSVDDGYCPTCYFTPKYHCELAGKGIEYTWGFDKKHFRGIPLSNRNTIQKFRFEAMKSFEIVTKEMVRKFSRRARSYMLVYAGNKYNSMSQKEIERQRHCYRGHRDVSRMDVSFIMTVWRQSVGSVGKYDFEKKQTDKETAKPAREECDKSEQYNY